jgi:hypothetical protein
MPVPTNLRRLLVLSLCASAGWLAGCDKDDAIRVYDAPKDPPAVVRARPIAWQLPAGWQEVADPMAGGAFGRYASIQVSESDPNLLLAVNQVSSGSTASNVNRWEGQLGLPPTPEAEIDKKVKKFEVETHPGFIIDLTGEKTDAKTQAKTPARMLAALVNSGGDEAWSFKLEGPPDKIASQVSSFEAFVRSVRFPGHDHSHDGHDHDAHADGDPHGGVPPTTGPAPTAQAQGGDTKSYKLAKFAAPSGWVQDPAERQFRAATFFVGAGDDKAEVIISKLRVNGFGTMLANVNRWRGEVGLPPSADEHNEQFAQSQIAGANAIVFDFDGSKAAGVGAAVAPKRSYVAMLAKGADVWFVKLIGPAKTVSDQRANYDAFLQSLQFGEAGE